VGAVSSAKTNLPPYFGKLVVVVTDVCVIFEVVTEVAGAGVEVTVWVGSLVDVVVLTVFALVVEVAQADKNIDTTIKPVSIVQ